MLFVASISVLMDDWLPAQSGAQHDAASYKVSKPWLWAGLCTCDMHQPHKEYVSALKCPVPSQLATTCMCRHSELGLPMMCWRVQAVNTQVRCLRKHAVEDAHSHCSTTANSRACRCMSG